MGALGCTCYESERETIFDSPTKTIQPYQPPEELQRGQLSTSSRDYYPESGVERAEPQFDEDDSKAEDDGGVDAKAEDGAYEV